MLPFRSIILCSLAAGSLGADILGPGAGPWKVETPAEHGLDAALLDAAKENIFANAGPLRTNGTRVPNTRGCLVIIKDGALVYEKYRSDAYKHTGHQGWSMTKTLGALIAGWAVTHSKLDIDKDITKTYGVKSPKSYPVTSRQIMSQSLYGKHGPGERWWYDAAGTEWINYMAKVLPAATGKNASQIWIEEFQTPLGLSEDFQWSDPSADYTWAYGSRGTCRDYARIMQLILNKGRWKGVSKPIVSAEYVHAMVTPQTKYAPYTNYSNPCYGLLTWLHPDTEKFPGTCLVPMNQTTPRDDEFPLGAPHDMFAAEGMSGQVAMALPRHNAVVVSMGDNADPSHIFPLIYSSLCETFGDCGSIGSIVV
eukprot:TRINITY_DN32509_c0_g1_i1.p1 TRINITY_DN32509_c0_g1~~TRINITY_DN32509_c0_g1_i1.p1  ORF type:complete len:378 (-),score=33.21 TRINITY_DN32509_c0_g1_i1:37-1134(-)